MMDITFKLAKTDDDLEQILALRHKILVGEENFIPETLEVEYSLHAIHLMALRGKEIVGAITVILNNGGGIPIEKHFPLSNLKTGERIAEFTRFAVLKEERRKETSLGLMALAYEIAKRNGVKHIFIDLFKEKLADIKAYKQMGFKIIGGYETYGSDIVVMGLDIENDSIYEKNKAKIEFRKSFIKHLSKSKELEELLK